MNQYLEIARPNVCILAGLGVLVGAVLTGATASPTLIYALAASLLICASGNTINDYFDYEIDKINKPKRPLPAKRLTKDSAVAYYFITGIAGMALSTLVNPTFLAIAVANFAIATLYAWKLKKIAIIGNITDSFLASVTFIAGGLVAGTISALAGSPVIILATIAFLTTMGREIFKDTEDIAGDRAAGAKTLPILTDEGTAMATARLFSVAAAASAILPYSYRMFGAYYLVAVIPCTAALLYSVILKDPKTAQKAVKTGMFLGIFAFLAGAYTSGWSVI